MELQLLVSTDAKPEEPSLLISGKYWSLSTIDHKQQGNIPSFSCISYIWGPEREPHAFEKGLTMSTHTRPALEAAIHTGKSDAFWTDVLCVPHQTPSRQATLENMGYIYSLASEVIIVLTAPTFKAIQEMIQLRTLSHDGLIILEQDTWVSSVWTYQEIVNSKNFYLISESTTDPDMAIDGSEFFSVLGGAMAKWMKENSHGHFSLYNALPNLSSFQDLMADWQLSGYLQRSAFLVMSSLDKKSNNDVNNYFYAMLGAITQEPSWDATAHNISDRFMSILEDKNDYSYIYSFAERDDHPSRLWRPKPWIPSSSEQERGAKDYIAIRPDILRPVLSWHSWGEAQTGYWKDERFWLDDMISLQLSGSMESLAKTSITSWIDRPDLLASDDSKIVQATGEAIKMIGFEGSLVPTIVKEGLVFPVRSIEGKTVRQVITSSQIRWAMGSPGFIELESNTGVVYVPSAFIGSLKDLNTAPVKMGA